MKLAIRSLKVMLVKVMIATRSACKAPSALTIWTMMLVFAGCTSAQTSPTNRLVMVTAFEPFGKWNVNLSRAVAEMIQKSSKSLGDDVEVYLCTLPVVYDLAAKKAQDCYEKLPKKPEMILSLGEGGCEIRLESAATNVDHAPKNADNAGVFRTMHTIVPNAERRSGFSLPIEQMYCALSDKDRAKVVPSVSPGNYVCNNASYHLSRYFRVERIPYGFVHVPHSGCGNAIKDPEANGLIVAKMLAAALHHRRRHPEPLQAPSQASEVQALLASADAKPTKSSALACRTQFLKGLGQAYENASKKATVQF